MKVIDGKKLEVVKKTIANYGGIFRLPESNILLTVKDEVFLANKIIYQRALDEKIVENLVSIGTQVGKFHKGNFLLGLESHLIMDMCSKKIKLNEKGSSLFLYGRDVFIKNIINPPKKGYILVSNTRNEVIGIGKFDGKMLNNIIDRGAYLRTLE